MWGKIIIPMYRLWLHGLYGPRCPVSPKRPINLISLSLFCKNYVYWAYQTCQNKQPRLSPIWSCGLELHTNHVGSLKSLDMEVNSPPAAWTSTQTCLFVKWPHCREPTVEIHCNIFWILDLWKFRLGSRIDPHRHRGVVKVHWQVPWVGGLFSWVVATFTL